MTTDSQIKSDRPSILGIWRLGKVIHEGRASELVQAQPADAAGSPRWDYVLRRAVGADRSIENARQIVQFSAACSTVSHPNLVPVLDASATGSSPYLVMPRLDGVTMQQLMVSKTKPLPVALWLVRQTAQALAAIHAGGWVHGDVRPENAIVGPNGHVTLIDLGFATKLNTSSRSHFRGSPEYSAPETQDGDFGALPSADVFSLGRVLWKWLTNIQSTDEQLLEPIADLVERMVQEDPTDRPTTASVTQALLNLEIDTLGQHMGPSLCKAA